MGMYILITSRITTHEFTTHEFTTHEFTTHEFTTHEFTTHEFTTHGPKYGTQRIRRLEKINSTGYTYL